MAAATPDLEPLPAARVDVMPPDEVTQDGLTLDEIVQVAQGRTAQVRIVPWHPVLPREHGLHPQRWE